MTEPIAPSDELIDFLRTRSTLVMSAASDSGTSDLCLGLACLFDDRRVRLRAVFDRCSAAPLLGLIAGGWRRVAVVASRPSDLRTVQIKGGDAQVLTLPVVERGEVERAIADMRAEFARVGRVALRKVCSALRLSLF